MPPAALAITPELLARKFVGKPFRWHGRGPEAYDCWGLVRACLLECGAANVPDYRSATEGAANALTILEAMWRGWRPLRIPEPGAVVVFRMELRAPTHCGFMLTGESFLHVSETTIGGTVVERLHPLWAGHVKGFYVWEGA